MLIAANLTFNIPVESAQIFGPCTDRIVKYMANKAAKNINSLDSHTMVPMETMLGRSAWVGTRTAVGVVTTLSLVGAACTGSEGGGFRRPCVTDVMEGMKDAVR